MNKKIGGDLYYIKLTDIDLTIRNQKLNGILKTASPLCFSHRLPQRHKCTLFFNDNDNL